jgi:hypothetical protein
VEVDPTNAERQRRHREKLTLAAPVSNVTLPPRLRLPYRPNPRCRPAAFQEACDAVKFALDDEAAGIPAAVNIQVSGGMIAIPLRLRRNPVRDRRRATSNWSAARRCLLLFKVGAVTRPSR